MVAKPKGTNGGANRTVAAAADCIHSIQEESVNRLTVASEDLDSLWNLIENMEARLKTLLGKQLDEGVAQGRRAREPTIANIGQDAGEPATACRHQEGKAAETATILQSSQTCSSCVPSGLTAQSRAKIIESVCASTCREFQGNAEPAPFAHGPLHSAEHSTSLLLQPLPVSHVANEHEWEQADVEKDKSSQLSNQRSSSLPPSSPQVADRNATTSTSTPHSQSEDPHRNLRPHRNVNNFFSSSLSTLQCDLDCRASCTSFRLRETGLAAMLAKSRCHVLTFARSQTPSSSDSTQPECDTVPRRRSVPANESERSRRALVNATPCMRSEYQSTLETSDRLDASDRARSSPLGKPEKGAFAAAAMFASTRRGSRSKSFTVEGHREMPSIHPVADGRCVFWTGGYDSTWRILQALLVEGLTVVPIYLSGVIDNYSSMQHNRRSTKFELTAMQAIRDEIVNCFPLASTRLKDLVVVPEVNLSKDVTKHMATLKSKNIVRRRRCQIGAMAQLSSSIATSVDVGIVNGEFLHQTLGPYLECSDGDNLVSMKAIEEMPELGIFRWLRFPLLKYSKEDILKEAKQRGYERIMRMTWTCWFPRRNGEQCGKCAMCRHRIL